MAYNQNNGAYRSFVYGPGVDAPIVYYRNDQGLNAGRRFLLADERGSIISVAQNDGALVSAFAYDEYGIPSSAPPAHGYTGQLWLPALGMWYYKARVYSPTLGRFMQTDPIGYGDGMNWYNYVGGDPVNFTDSTGMFAGGGLSCTFRSIITMEYIDYNNDGNRDSGEPWQPGSERSELADLACFSNADFGGVRRFVGVEGDVGGGILERNGPKPPSHDDDDPDYNEDLNKCRALEDRGARARCYESAERRKYDRDRGVPDILLPPLILWRIQPFPIPSPRCLRIRHPIAILGCEIILH